jgi:hypothetical protein
MSAVNFQSQEEEFIEAQTNWQLDKLYVDLASAKGKALTPVEKKLLRGLLCGCSPAEIAQKIYQTRNSSTVRVYLSNGVYKYIEEMLANQLGYTVKIKNWSHVTHLLEKAGYKKNLLSVPQTNSFINNASSKGNKVLPVGSRKTHDWGEAVEITDFCGRETELTTVSTWILQQDCRLVAILGVGGIGKTAFSINLVQEIQDQFECVIWRSLHFYPSLDDLLTDILQTLSPHPKIEPAANLNLKISQLIGCLSQQRCLLVLDHLDSILSSDDSDSIHDYKSDPVSQIKYQPGYEGYGEFIKRVGNCQHQSCLLITSTVTPPELAEIEGQKLPVRSYKLKGLNTTESLFILENKGLITNDYTDTNILIDNYAGHPLFLKLVANTINNLFSGNIYHFIQQNTFIFGDIRRSLDQQFNSISGLEKYIMYWLVLNPDLTNILTLTSHIVPGYSQNLGSRLILESLELLQRRSFIDITSGNLSLSKIWIEYVRERLREKNLQGSTEVENSFVIQDEELISQFKNYFEKS